MVYLCKTKRFKSNKIQKNVKKLLPNKKIYPKYETPKQIGVSPSGKASAFGVDIRRFESCHPSQNLQTVRNDGFFFIN